MQLCTFQLLKEVSLPHSSRPSSCNNCNCCSSGWFSRDRIRVGGVSQGASAQSPLAAGQGDHGGTRLEAQSQIGLADSYVGISWSWSLLQGTIQEWCQDQFSVLCHQTVCFIQVSQLLAFRLGPKQDASLSLNTQALLLSSIISWRATSALQPLFVR